MHYAEKIQHLFITSDTAIIDALKQMDAQDRKVLIVMDGDRFKSVVSIGDIQRAIIQNIPYENPVQTILREKITVAKSTQSRDDIIEMMLQFRAEMMPVINNSNHLIDVYFWEDVFQERQPAVERTLPTPVVVMAGGKGTRLKPITNVIPKPLIPIGDKPIIEIILERFGAYGIRDFFLTVNYKADLLEFAMKEMAQTYHLSYIHEPKPLGTAGSLQYLKGKIDSTFFVTNCDIIIEQDYSEIYDYHQQAGNQITIVASLKHLQLPYGVIYTGENGKLTDISEKPEFTFMINSGMYILEPEILERIPKDEFYHITDLIADVRADHGEIGVFPVSEKSWYDIGIWTEYQQTINRFSR